MSIYSINYENKSFRTSNVRITSDTITIQMVLDEDTGKYVPDAILYAQDEPIVGSKFTIEIVENGTIIRKGAKSHVATDNWGFERELKKFMYVNREYVKDYGDDDWHGKDFEKDLQDVNDRLTNFDQTGEKYND